MALSNHYSLVVGTLLAVGSTTGCTRSIVDRFHCTEHIDCLDNGAAGICEANNTCSYTDTTCPSGRRYGAFSGAVSGRCVDQPTTRGDAGTDQRTGLDGQNVDQRPSDAAKHDVALDQGIVDGACQPQCSGRECGPDPQCGLPCGQSVCGQNKRCSPAGQCVLLTDRDCSVDRFCWDHPLPHGEFLYAVWGSSATDIYASGSSGRLQHYDGNDWLPIDLGTRNTVHALWGDSRTNVYAAGIHTPLYHYDGQTWTVAATPPIPVFVNDIWGRGKDDLFLTSPNGLRHFDGQTFAKVPLPNSTTGATEAIWGDPTTGEAFAVGPQGKFGICRATTSGRSTLVGPPQA